MIFNIDKGVFGGSLRSGDILGVANIVAYFRKIHNNPNIQFYMCPGSIMDTDYTQKMFFIIKGLCDYFSDIPNEENYLKWKNLNIWDFRAISGDLVVLTNKTRKTKKIVIFPLFDAPYNFYRNWSHDVFREIVNKFQNQQYDKYQKIIAVKDKNILPFVPEGFHVSFDYLENLNHIMEAEIFVGGDTGTSHFASSLDNGPSELYYLYSTRGLLHTVPFYSLYGKGKILQYFLNLENTQW